MLEDIKKVDGEHAVKVTEVVVSYYPDHPPRKETSTFSKTKRDGKRAGLRCAISGAENPEYHHLMCEEAYMLAVDWKTVKDVATGAIKQLPVLDEKTDLPTKETYPVEQSLIYALCKLAEIRGFDWKSFDPSKPETFVDSAQNMLPLSSKFHRSSSHGIHHRDFPTWIFQAFPRVDGFVFTDDEVK